MISKQLLWIVLSTHNLEPSRSTLPLFKIFKFQSLQVWTRFVKFGEIHISSSPKIPPKFRQPRDAMRGHPTKNQLKENLPHTRIILSNTWPALLLCIFRKIQSFRKFSVVSSLVFSHLSTVRLARCARPLLPVWSAARALGWFLASVAPWPACAGVFRGGRTSRGGRQGAPCGTTPFSTAQAT